MMPADGYIHVFVSWSGERARKVAIALREWLPTVVNECKPWVPEDDIAVGKAWDPEILRALARASVGIICATPENADEPWLNFEAGTISKQVSDEQFVIPLAIGFADPTELKPPMGCFQTVLANEDGARRIHEMLNRRRAEPLPAATIAEIFEGMWPKLRKTFDEVARSAPPMKREERDKVFASPAAADRLSRWLTRVRGDGLLLSRSDSFAIGSATGLVRGENQDRALLLRTVYLGQPLLLAVVCDGIGGMNAGAECAEIATAQFATSFLAHLSSGPSSAVHTALSRSNSAVYDVHHGKGGAVLVAVAVRANSIVGVNVGDARVYMLRRDGAAQQLSSDDTIAAQVAAALPSLSSSDVRNELLQFVGIGSELEPHFFERTSLDDVRGILLTSDGIHGELGPEFAPIVAGSGSPRRLVDDLLRASERHGGRDNASAIAVTTRDLGITPDDGIVEFYAPRGYLEIWPDRMPQTAVPTLSKQPQTYVKRTSPSPLSHGGKNPAGKKHHGKGTKRRDEAKREQEQDSRPPRPVVEISPVTSYPLEKMKADVASVGAQSYTNTPPDRSGEVEPTKQHVPPETAQTPSRPEAGPTSETEQSSPINISAAKDSEPRTTPPATKEGET